MKLGLDRIIVLLAIGICGSCNSPDEPSCGITVRYDGSSISYCPSDASSLIRPQDEFIWQGMNLYYHWQSEVANLADDRFSSFDEMYQFLNTANSSEALFYGDLLSTKDRFSVIIDDYEVLDNLFQGISTTFGYEVGFTEEPVGDVPMLAYVGYVVPNGPADLAGLKRGDVFDQVNGVPITSDNIRELFTLSTYTLSLVKIENDAVVSLDRTVELTRVVLEENPIHLSKTLDLSGTKVGYLAYNQFVRGNEALRALNRVFGQFKTNGITELVVDLRYNPGGFVSTTEVLASMILGSTTANDDLGTIVYNEKLSEFFNRPIKFAESFTVFDENGVPAGEESLNRLQDLNRVFILTSDKTASASELLIVGLDPYMEVIHIGMTTTGKNEGSVTLYDSRNSLYLSNEEENLNDMHKYAMQPIVSRLANSEGFVDYSSGLVPDIEIDERKFLVDLKPLGDQEEPLLAEAIAVIEGTARRALPPGLGTPYLYKDDQRLMKEKTLIDAQYVPKLRINE